MSSPQSASILHLLQRLWGHVQQRRRRQLMLLLVLMVLTSFAEVVSIGSVLPFLSALTGPDKVFSLVALQPLFLAVGVEDAQDLLLPLTVGFGVAALLAGAMRLLLLWATTRLAFAAGADLSMDIYSRTLYQPYAVHVARNSSEVISGISTKSEAVIFGVLMPVIIIISSAIMLVAILLAMLLIDPVIALAAFAGFGMIYAIVIRLARQRLATNSARIADKSTQVIKSLQEGLGGIRDVLLDGTQAVYCKVYRDADMPLRRAQGSNHFIGIFPRFGIETLGMLLIAVLAYAMANQPGGVSAAIPVLGALALGAQRLLPVLQQAYSSWTSIRSAQVSLEATLELLDQPIPAYASEPPPIPILFNQSITLRQISFRYGPSLPWILRGLDLEIHRGESLGFIGTTGSGKSTLIDLIMGLLQPDVGTLSVDNAIIGPTNLRGWQAHIAHVPQLIFLADSSVAENIAFGVPAKEIDMARVRRAAQQAQIAHTIESWPAHYETRVGERGVRLSGGQRQRIGIARAIYKQADVLVFDEATSSLDNETEDSVMDAIYGLGEQVTVLLIAHRLTTLQQCDRIVQLDGSGACRVSSYEALIQR